MMRCFRYRLVSTFRRMIVDHDDRSDNVSFLDSGFEIRDESSHSCLQRLRSVAVTTLARNPAKGLQEPWWKGHADSRRWYSPATPLKLTITVSILFKGKYNRDESVDYPITPLQPHDHAK